MAGKKQSALDLIRTKFWLKNVMRITNVENANQLGEKLDPPGLQQSLYRCDIRKPLYKYAAGKVAVSEKTLKLVARWLVEHQYDLPDSSKLFDIGPHSEVIDGGFAPLWDALGDSIADIQAVLVSYDPAVLVQKYQGISFRLRCSSLIFRVFGEYEPQAYWENTTKENHVAKRCRDGNIEITIDLITLAIASWRISHVSGDSIPMMNYILIGLLDEAIPDFASAHGIEEDLLAYLKRLDDQHLKGLQTAVEILNTTANRYPPSMEENVTVGEDGYIQPLKFDYLMARIKQSSVAEYIARRKKTVGEERKAESIEPTA